MKLLVFADRFDVGGTQVNSIDLAEALRDRHGHDVVIYAAPGPMVEVAEARGLRFISAPRATSFPTTVRMRALQEVVRAERPDLIHVWDWPQCLDAMYGVYIRQRLPMVVSVMTMDISRLLPKYVPTTFGTPKLLDEARAAGRERVELILPPVDVHHNAAGRVDGEGLRKRYNIRRDEVLLVVVSRLVQWMKAEGIRRTMAAVRDLNSRIPVRFLIVGDGTGRTDLEKMGEEINRELSRSAIVFTGAMVDPREAYAAADVVVGMGSSALRGMAFAKPVLVVGEQGFSAPFNKDTAGDFYYEGIYGRGDGNTGCELLCRQLEELLRQRNEWEAVGNFSRQFVHQHFAVEVVAERLAKLFTAAVHTPPPLGRTVLDAVRTTAITFGRQYVPAALRKAIAH